MGAGPDERKGWFRRSEFGDGGNNSPLILNLLKEGRMVVISSTFRLQWRKLGGGLNPNPTGGGAVATFVFDTHRAVKDLAAAGFPEAQAEALVEIVGAAVGENAATKADLDAMEQRLTARFDAKFAAQKQDTDARIAALEQRMEARFEAMEQRMDARFAALESKLDAEIRAVRADMRDMEQRLTLKFIAILLPSLGLLFAALRLLPG